MRGTDHPEHTLHASVVTVGLPEHTHTHTHRHRHRHTDTQTHTERERERGRASPDGPGITPVNQFP